MKNKKNAEDRVFSFSFLKKACRNTKFELFHIFLLIFSSIPKFERTTKNYLKIFFISMRNLDIMKKAYHIVSLYFIHKKN